jgi:hypothetical protein
LSLNDKDDKGTLNNAEKSQLDSLRISAAENAKKCNAANAVFEEKARENNEKAYNKAENTLKLAKEKI